MLCRMEDNLFDVRRLQRTGNQKFGRIMPADQVDSLPTKRIDNTFDAGATNSDTGANAIHTRVLAAQGEFAAIPRLARDGLDLDVACGNLGHLLREKPSDEFDVFRHMVASRHEAERQSSAAGAPTRAVPSLLARPARRSAATIGSGRTASGTLNSARPVTAMCHRYREFGV
jgi:hypothetical protein